MNWLGRKVLVTGGGGFIGSHLCEQLVREGADVTAFVRYTSRGAHGLLQLLHPDIRASIRWVAGDLQNPEAMARALKGQEVLFHLAALIGIPYSYVHSSEVVQVNIIGTINVLNAARDASVSRVVHTSTSEVYGTGQRVPINEERAVSGQSPYSASKIGADALAYSYWRSFDVPLATIRPFNTYGPRQSGRAVNPTIVGQTLPAGKISLGSLSRRFHKPTPSGRGPKEVRPVRAVLDVCRFSFREGPFGAGRRTKCTIARVCPRYGGTASTT